MAKFEYDSKVLTIEAYGKTLLLAKKTPALVEKINEVSQAQTIKEDFQKTYDVIGDIIGKEARSEIFPSFDEVDTDEMSCFWLFLCRVYRDRVNELAKKFRAQAISKNESAS